MKNKITFTGANTVFFAFIAGFVAFQILLIIPTLIWGQDFIDRNIYGVLLINQYVIILGPVLAYVFFKKLDIREVFRLKRLDVIPGILIILIAPAASLVAGMLNTFVVYLLQFIGKVPDQPIPIPHNLPELLIGLLVIAVSPAICEELLHRGILLSGYERRGTMKAVVFTAILFGIFHFDITNFFGPIFLGLLIGYYVVRTGSIFAGMLAHFMNNAFSLLLSYFMRDNSAPGDFIKLTEQDLNDSFFYGVTGLIVTGLLLTLFRKATENRSRFTPAISSVKTDVVAIISHWPIIVVLSLYIFFALLSLLVIATSGL